MPTSAATLITQTRRLLRDFPQLDTIAASLGTSDTTVTTTQNPASDLYMKNRPIQIDTEVLMVRTSSSVAGSITVARAAHGSTAATHTSGTSVMVHPRWFDVEILDALNMALDAVFPALYQPFTSEYTGIEDDEYEYNLPTMTDLSRPIPHVWKLEYQESSDTGYYLVRNWRVVRADTPLIQFRIVPPSGGTLRIHGFGPFAHLTSTSSTLDTLYPANAEDLLPLYAAAWLLDSGEAGRVSVDTGAVDSREQANRVGASGSVANKLYARFERRLQSAAMPPLPKPLAPPY